jgi:GrpB-like predicted nucleotidyltransferase (UPF0157 family)/8-oxo-dGTP pyrophosphatase MutT (NUDIX family)
VAEEIARRRPVIVNCRADWPDRAAELIAVLAGRLGPLAPRIEHIGSTSIPGMAAKDLIDLQASTRDLDAAEAAFDEPLRGLGFTLTPYRRDHVPPGGSDDPRLWAKRLWSRESHPDGPVNLHVRAIGSANERLALLFRDWFRAHPDATPAYSGFKQALAAMSAGIGDYTQTKDWVVDLVVAIAEPWAAATGWAPWTFRRAGRVLVVDARGRILLLHGLDPARAGEPYWITVGGGARPGETLAQAAARELAEESGIPVRPDELGEPVWHDIAEFDFKGRWFCQEQDYFSLRVGSPQVRSDAADDEEATVVTGHRWWTIDELESTDEAFYPAELPGLLRALTA